MNKRITLLLALLFISAQTFSLWHMAAYGFKPHKHDGHTCDISHFINNYNDSDIPAGINIPVSIQFIILILAIASLTPRQGRRCYSGEPRAPPVFSL